MTCYTNPFKKRLFRVEDRVKEIDEKLLELEKKMDKPYSMRETATEPAQPTNQTPNQTMIFPKKRKMYHPINHYPASVFKQVGGGGGKRLVLNVTSPTARVIAAAKQRIAYKRAVNSLFKPQQAHTIKGRRKSRRKRKQIKK